jgi:hypothetical protein
MKYSYCLLTILLTLTCSLKHHSGFHLSTTLTHLTASGFTQSLADKLSSDPQVRDLVLKLNQTELSQTVLTKMLDLIKSNSTLLKQLTDQVWQNTPESLKSLTDGEKEGLVNMALSHPEGFGKEVEGPKVLEWVKGQDALKGLAEKMVPKVSHLSGSGDVQQKIAEAILKDPTISRLIK